MNSTRRNVGLLAACQALLLTNNATLIAINGLAGLALAPRAALATLPVTGWVVGAALATMPASLHMRRVGRRAGLTAGTLWGVAGALICAGAVWAQSFWLLCFGTLVFGVFNAYGQYYRFAAADVASADFKSTAVSLVLAGGLIGGILGPTTSRFTVDLLEPRFMGAYLALIGFAIATMLVLRYIHIPPLDATAKASALPI
jgi:MFS family permease